MTDQELTGERPAGQSVEVRRVTPDEWEIYRTVRLAALAESPEAFASTIERELTFPEELWRGRLQSAQTFLAWLAGQPAGTVTVLSCDPSNDYGFPGTDHVVAMWVDPQARGLGVADRLVEAVLARARDAGVPGVVLWVFEANERAGAFYRRMGFRATETTMYQPHRPGEREVLMVRELT